MYLSVREQYFQVDGKVHIPNVAMFAQFKVTWDNGQRIGKDKLDRCYFKVGDNYGNCLFTDRATGNKLYKAMTDGTINTQQRNTFAVLKAMREFLDGQGATYNIGCSMP